MTTPTATTTTWSEPLSVHEFPPPAGHDPDENISLLELKVQTLDEFVAVEEDAAESLMGDDDNCALPAGGTVVLYGKGGAGKTTLEVDWLAHLGAGDDWLGLDVPRSTRILAIENEGPRYKFRQKLGQKLDSWTGSTIGEHFRILEDPWAVFSFRRSDHIAALANVIEDLDIELLAAGPINRLGMKGGGTPDEVGEFMQFVETLRQTLDRPLAVMFAHHDNKGGEVSGAWEGIPDTLVHVKAIGNGQTLVTWEKVRWGSDLHQQTWTLKWVEGRSYELEEKRERTDAELEADVISFISENEGTGWTKVRQSVAGRDEDLARIRDALLASGRVENHGRGNNMKLTLNSQNGQFPVSEDDIRWQ